MLQLAKNRVATIAVYITGLLVAVAVFGPATLTAHQTPILPFEEGLTLHDWEVLMILGLYAQLGTSIYIKIW